MKKKQFNGTAKLSKKRKLELTLRYLGELLPGKSQAQAHNFIAQQVKHLASNVNRKGIRWSSQTKAFSLTLYHQSPKCYKMLRSIFSLPTIRTLKQEMQKLDIKPGFHPSILTGMQEKVKNFSEKQKLCAIIFDEMSLKEAITYSPQKDRMDGSEDFGEEGTTKYVANHACVFMVRGIVEKWKQAVGYVVSSGTVSSVMLLTLLLSCITKLQDIGLKVKLLICDQGSNNRSMIGKLGVNFKRPYFMHRLQKIYVLYDPPHLIKNIRNNLKNTGYIVGKKKVIWDHIKEFFS